MASPIQRSSKKDRAPCFEALAAGHVDCFRSFFGAKKSLHTPEVLARLLAGRADKLTVSQLEAIESLEAGAVLLRRAAPALLIRLARRGDQTAVKTLLRFLGAAATGLVRQASREGHLLLHAVADSGSVVLLDILRDVLGVLLLKELAQARDAQGQLPVDGASARAMQEALQPLYAPAGRSSEALAAPAKIPSYLNETARLAALVSGNLQQEDVRETQVLAFVKAAQQALIDSGQNPKVAGKVQVLAWRVIEQLGCAANGAGMGCHYDAHLPGKSDEQLKERARTYEKTGSSCFGQQDGLTVLLLRQQALAKAKTD